MPRKPDTLNIRKRTVRRNGRRVTVYQVRIRLQDDRGVLRTHTQTFDNLEDATLWRDRKRSQVRLGEAGDNLERNKPLRDTTLGELISRYQSTSSRFMFERRSWANERIILNAFLKDETKLCKKSLADLTQKDFADYRDRRLYGPNPVNAATVRRALVPIRHMFNVARGDWGYEGLPNPFYGLRVPKENPEERHILKPEERFRLYRAMQQQCRGKLLFRWASLVTVALNTALRRGELLKVEWRDVDFVKWTLYVRAENSKTGKPRLLPLTRLALTQLRN